MYVWTRMPAKYENASDFTDELVLATGVSISPGDGFGKYGAGFVRMALVQPKERLAEAVKRIDDWGGLK